MTLLPLLLAAAPLLELPSVADRACLEGGFIQTRSLPALSQPLVMHGQLRIRPPDSFEWRINSPYEYGFLVDGDRITETMPNGSVRELESSQAPWLVGMRQIFSALFAGEAATILEWFEVSSEETLADGGRKIVLSPLSEALAHNVRELEIEHDEHLQSVLMRESGEGRIEIRFEPLTDCSGTP